MIPTKAYRKAIQRTPGLAEDAARLLATYDVTDLAALTGMLRASLAGHKAKGAARYGVPPELELRLLPLAYEAIAARREHGDKSKEAKAIGSKAMRMIETEAPPSLAPGSGRSRARLIWDGAIKKVEGQS